MTSSNRIWMIVGVTVGSAVVILLAAAAIILLWPTARVADGNPTELVGKWSSDYYDGKMALTLHQDGTFREELSGFEKLPGETATGRWKVDDQRLILTPFVRIYPFETWNYETSPQKAVDVKRTIWGSVYMVDVEELSFHPAPASE
jgi:hypothetical protein